MKIWFASGDFDLCGFLLFQTGSPRLSRIVMVHATSCHNQILALHLSCDWSSICYNDDSLPHRSPARQAGRPVKVRDSGSIPDLVW